MTPKVSGPLFSFGARGNIGRILTYSKTFGGNVVKRTPKVKELPSDLQKEIREIYKAGKNVWKDMTDEEKQVYIDMAEGKPRTGFNMFMAEYLDGHTIKAVRGLYGTALYAVHVYWPD